jgi:hypothetical protein
LKASKELQKRIDHLVSTLVPFKGRYVRDIQDGILVAFDSVIDAARYAEYVSPKCPAHLIAEGQRSIDFNSGVMVFLSVE